MSNSRGTSAKEEGEKICGIINEFAMEFDEPVILPDNFAELAQRIAKDVELSLQRANEREEKLRQTLLKIDGGVNRILEENKSLTSANEKLEAKVKELENLLTDAETEVGNYRAHSDLLSEKNKRYAEVIRDTCEEDHGSETYCHFCGQLWTGREPYHKPDCVVLSAISDTKGKQ